MCNKINQLCIARWNEQKRTRKRILHAQTNKTKEFSISKSNCGISSSLSDIFFHSFIAFQNVLVAIRVDDCIHKNNYFKKITYTEDWKQICFSLRFHSFFSCFFSLVLLRIFFSCILLPILFIVCNRSKLAYGNNFFPNQL